MNETKQVIPQSSQDDPQTLQIERLKKGFNKTRGFFFWPLIGSLGLLILLWILPLDLGFLNPLSWAIFLVSFLIYYLTFNLKRVFEGERGVVLRLGGFHRACKPGLRLIWGSPVIDKMIFIDIRAQKVDISPQEVVTKDNATVKADAFLVVKVDVDSGDLEESMKKYVFAAKDPKGIVRDLALSRINTIIGEDTYDTARANQKKIGETVAQDIQTDAKSWGLVVQRCMLENIIAPPDLVAAMNKRKAEQELKEAAILHAQGEAEAFKTFALAVKEVDPKLKLRSLQVLERLPNLVVLGQNTGILKDLIVANHSKKP